MLSRNGAVVICSFVTPYNNLREKIKKEIEELRKQIQISIAEENFEEAARLRDEIKELNLQLEGGVPDGN